MNITFLIGNGFDLGIGLKTGYADFYDYFIGKSTPNNMIRNQLIDAKQNGTYDTWADLEIALGNYTEYISVENHEEFIDSKIELDELLLAYLEKEQVKMQFDDEAIKERVINALAEIRLGNSVEERATIEKVLDVCRAESYLYYAISFNYTNCFDYFFNVTKKLQSVIQVHKNGNSSYQERIEDVMHIHGTLNDGEMILGVNDVSQIKNSELAQIGDIKRALIKPYLNSELGQNKIQAAEKIINSSGIICICGMSIGDTDKMWWESIGKWLLGGEFRVLIIFSYNPDYKVTHPFKKLKHREDVKKLFMLKAGIPEKNQTEIIKRIIIYINNDIWQYKSNIKGLKEQLTETIVS